MIRGKYIVIEGAEGVGKTTMIRCIAHELRAAGLPVRVMTEPDRPNDITASAIQRLTEDPRYTMNTRTELLLHNAARIQSLENIHTAIENGVYCLVDRSYLTTLAVQYYGHGDSNDYDAVNDIISFTVGGQQPDLLIVLDAPVSTLRDRLQKGNDTVQDDSLDDAMLERIRGWLSLGSQATWPSGRLRHG